MDVDVSGASVSDSEGCGSTPSSSGHLSGQSSGGGGKLKRSSSAPMINQLVPQGPVSAPTTASATREMVSNEVHGAQPRVRRFSASFGPVSPLSPGSTRGSGPLRVCQLRVEEGMDVVNREAAHERTVQSALQITDSLSQSWEDLTLTEDVGRPKSHSISGGSISTSMAASLSVPSSVSHSVPGTVSGAMSSMRRDFADPLHLTIVPTVVPLTGCGASPTRGVGRQCFSPSLQQHVRNTSFCPSPSPTKKTFATRRSLSPIALRPSPLGGLKRKWEVDERCEPFLTPSKRASTCNPERCIGGLLITQPHSLESTPSPAGPGSLGSVGTPESICSSGSPGLSAPPYSPASLSETPAQTPDPPPHLFKPVSPALATDQTSSFGNQNHGDRFGSQEHSNRFSSQNHSDQFGSREHSDRYREQESREQFMRQQHRDQFGRQDHHGSGDSDRFEGDEQVKGDTSDGSSSDAMITEDVPPSDLKSYQDMDLSESLTHPPLNI
ncbi:PPP2R1A-PPP2R2A-interacting phosphatase regulator 1 [Macrobrachium rosenbergii]|uniref:PPP2R1A-PPP2R2A-interacting phosphatase regulator 1 n=1 Tax=Macrobrachium rosenbergii TaxID=79674 RepID=UPI0034D5B7FB